MTWPTGLTRGYIATAVIVQFVSTFAVWMIAEGLHLSGIITMVVFAIAVAREAPDRIPARLRIPSYAVWEVVVFVLNVLAFILVGLQLKPILARLSRAEGSEAVGRAVVEETGRIIDYHNARVYVLEPAGDLVPIAFEGRVGAYEKVDLNLLRTRLGHGFTGWVGQHGEPLLVRDANDDPRGASIPGTDDVDESMLVVPMRYDDAVVGVITLSKLGLDQFDGHDLRLLSILADQAATALESARNLARSHSLAGELRLLLEVSSELAANGCPRMSSSISASW